MAPLALTLGEPAGVGPDITLLAWQQRVENTLPPFYIVGDIDLLTRRAARLGISVPMKRAIPEDAEKIFP